MNRDEMNRDEIYDIAETVWGVGEVHIGPGIENLMHFAKLVHRTAKRQWVGLTDEAIWLEYQTLWPFHPAEEPRLAKDIAKFARALEAKLKEKNT